MKKLQKEESNEEQENNEIEDLQDENLESIQDENEDSKPKKSLTNIFLSFFKTKKDSSEIDEVEDFYKSLEINDEILEAAPESFEVENFEASNNIVNQEESVIELNEDNLYSEEKLEKAEAQIDEILNEGIYDSDEKGIYDSDENNETLNDLENKIKTKKFSFFDLFNRKNKLSQELAQELDIEESNKPEEEQQNEILQPDIEELIKPEIEQQNDEIIEAELNISEEEQQNDEILQELDTEELNISEEEKQKNNEILEAAPELFETENFETSNYENKSENSENSENIEEKNDKNIEKQNYDDFSFLNLDLEQEDINKKENNNAKSFFEKIFKKNNKNDLNKNDLKEDKNNLEVNDNTLNNEVKTIISQDTLNDDIFQELQNLSFDGDLEEDIEKQKLIKHPIYLSYKISSTLALLSIILMILISVDIYFKTAQDNTIVSSLPICSYLSWSIDGYDNKDCKTLPMIVGDLSKEKNVLEKNIVSNLHILLPKKLETDNISNSSEVQFIQEKTGDSRIYIKDILQRFDEIRKMSPYKGEDIECNGLSLDEEGNIETSCSVYGGSIFSKSFGESSRMTAINFLKNLQNKNNGFMIINFPKSININKYFSSDGGIKGAFTTETSLNLKLKYISNNKM